MRERRPTSGLLRRCLPLLAVPVLLGPSAALAGNPRPDTPPPAPPPVSNLSPDPAPGVATTPAAAAPRRRTAIAPPVTHAAVVPAAVHTTAAPVHRTPVAKRPKPSPHRPAAPVPRVRIVDVAPHHVDVPIGLGAVAAGVRDDSSAVLAAIALLVAACAAASGIALTVVAGREGAAA